MMNGSTIEANKFQPTDRFATFERRLVSEVIERELNYKIVNTHAALLLSKLKRSVMYIQFHNWTDQT